MNAPDSQEMRKVIIDFLRTGDKQYEPEISDLMKKCRYDVDQFVKRLQASPPFQSAKSAISGG